MQKKNVSISSFRIRNLTFWLIYEILYYTNMSLRDHCKFSKKKTRLRAELSPTYTKRAVSLQLCYNSIWQISTLHYSFRTGVSSQLFWCMLGFTCHLSWVTCHPSWVTCHPSLSYLPPGSKWGMSYLPPSIFFSFGSYVATKIRILLRFGEKLSFVYMLIK